MPKSPQALQVLPPAATQALRALGENLAIARVRRHESQRAWAKRLGVSVPTLIRLERGDPGVGAGIYATALWLMGRVSALPDLAAPGDDRGALESDVREAVQRRAVRSAASTEARLGRGKAKYGSDAAVAEAPPQPWGSAAKASQPSANQPKASEPRPRGSTTDRKADK
jgi:transcriptional regulator with XRE-family HTH domain